jgi:hypothetical protein
MQVRKGIRGLSGIKYASQLNFFYFAENLDLDAMHDFLVGVAPFSIKIVLRALATIYLELGVEAEFLNKKIESFSY